MCSVAVRSMDRRQDAPRCCRRAASARTNRFVLYSLDLWSTPESSGRVSDGRDEFGLSRSDCIQALHSWLLASASRSSRPWTAASKSWGQVQQRGGDVGNRCSSRWPQLQSMLLYAKCTLVTMSQRQLVSPVHSVAQDARTTRCEGVVVFPRPRQAGLDMVQCLRIARRAPSSISRHMHPTHTTSGRLPRPLLAVGASWNPQ